MRDVYRNIFFKTMRHYQTKRNFHTFKSCYISDDNMRESIGYIRCNFRFYCVVDLLLYLQDKPTHFLIDCVSIICLQERVFDLLQSMSATSIACAADTSFSARIFTKSRTIGHQINIRPI